MSVPASPAISLIVMAIGPERVVARAIDTAIRQTAPSIELIVVHDRDDDAALVRLSGYLDGRPAALVPARGMSPGAARNAGVRRSTCGCLLVIDGSEALEPEHASRALQALETEPEAAFAAASGGALFGIVSTSSPDQERPSTGLGASPSTALGTSPSTALGTSPSTPPRIDASSLVGGAWSVGPAVIRRRVFDETGGFDETLPALVDWDFLLCLIDAGKTGLRISGPGSRYADDDVRLRESLAAQHYLPAMRRIFARHQPTFEGLMRVALVERDRAVKALWDHERALLTRREATLANLNSTLDQISDIRPELARHGLRTLDFSDLRRTSPVSRNWGSERGRPVDRHYIHRFLTDHAGDVRGQVLEMLDAELTTTYGGDRVERSDILDIDPGNARATVIADLRVAEQLPAEAYDCFILTQTLHLIDDMQAALRTAYRLLKPGGVLLVTLPCASMVAVEYGPKGDHWRVTEAGARALFERVFHPADLSIRAHGNVLTIAAFLYGLCCDDLDPGEFAVDDPAYPLLITVRAQKPAAIPRRIETVPRKPSAAVVLYHRVAVAPHDHHALAVSPEAFRSQVQHLCQSWRVLPLRTLAAAAASGDLPERGIALTFDDGYVDNLEIAAPILAELGVPATFYLTTELPGTRRRFWWDVLEEMLLWSDGCPERIELQSPWTIVGRS